MRSLINKLFGNKKLTFKPASKEMMAAASNLIIPYRPILPPKKHKQVLALDMDETLIYTTDIEPTDQRIKFLHFLQEDAYVYLRPGLSEFLTQVLDMFDVFLFTSAENDYANQIMNSLEPTIPADHRLYHSSCKFVHGRICKDLTVFKRPLTKVIMVDDSPIVFSFFPSNVIPIHQWRGSPDDNELLERILPVLIECTKRTDVRSVIETYPKW